MKKQNQEKVEKKNKDESQQMFELVSNYNADR